MVFSDFKQDLEVYRGQEGQGSIQNETPDFFTSDFRSDLQNFKESETQTKLQSASQEGQMLAQHKENIDTLVDNFEPTADIPKINPNDEVAQHQATSPEELVPTSNIEIDYANVDLSRADLTAVPEGTVGGHCGVYAENVVKMPGGGNWLVGDTIQQKKQSVERYRKAGLSFKPGEDAPQAGNAFIMDPGTKWGHVAVINKIEDGIMTITESNWRNDKRVTHSRKMRVDDPSIVGFLRTK